MKPEVILVAVFGLSLFIMKLVTGSVDIALSGRIGMTAMLLFTALGHFLFPKGMAMMMPPFIPYKTGMVYFTGVIEIAAAIGLLIPGLRLVTAWLLILFFILILPANIYGAIHHVDLQKASTDGKGLGYLWYRVPLQIFFIAWVYISGVLNFKF